MCPLSAQGSVSHLWGFVALVNRCTWMQQKWWDQTKQTGTSATYWPGEFTHALNVLESSSEFWKTEMNQISPTCSNNLLIFFFTDFHVQGLECNLGSTSTNPLLHESHPLLSSIVLNHSLSSSRTPSALSSMATLIILLIFVIHVPVLWFFSPTVTLMLVIPPTPPAQTDMQ